MNLQKSLWTQFYCIPIFRDFEFPSLICPSKSLTLKRTIVQFPVSLTVGKLTEFNCSTLNNFVVSAQDNEICINVIDECLQILNTEDKWNPLAEYGEQCDLDARQFTLGCALEKAQIIHRGQKENRSAEIRAIRRKIYANFFWRAGLHPVTYFNKHRKTSFADILFILNETKKKFIN